MEWWKGWWDGTGSGRERGGRGRERGVEGVGVGVKEVWKGAKDSKVDESRKIDESLMAVWAPFPGAALIRVSSMLAKGEWHACFLGRRPSPFSVPPLLFFSLTFTFSLLSLSLSPVPHAARSAPNHT